ncbi:hypothetical protein SEA_LIMPID_156 [Streptomyces phage Limpid]|uniref:Uncharacterized protein n=1 Tax=Streptomyces phage Limpid TaxID=2653770 RepID=A0A5Q2WLW2_9CAUD|nr:hypothetical protein SEA_LIMPID_156 [Streptomyces phage Limpid]
MARLIINRTDSRCGECNKSASPHEMGHFTVYGYVDNGSPGCGELWDSVESDYINLPKQMTEWHFNMPHLIGLPVYNASIEPIGLFGGQTRENATLPPVSEEDDDTIYEAEDLR